MAELKGALIGCGFFAVNQMHAWNDVEGAEIVAICDRDPERLKIVGDQFGIERALQRRRRRCLPTAASISSTSPPPFRATGACGDGRQRTRSRRSARNPSPRRLIDAKAMVEACRTAGIPLMVHENFRWQTPIQAVKTVLDAGAIGDALLGSHFLPLRLRRLLRPALSRRGRALHHRGSRHPYARHRALHPRRRHAAHGAHQARQPEDQGRGCRDHSARPRKRRDLDRRRQLCDETLARSPSRRR